MALEVLSDHKLFLLGIDGATWSLLDPWIQQGELPIFKKQLKLELEQLSRQFHRRIQPQAGPPYSREQIPENTAFTILPNETAILCDLL